jgi:endogenous inhibitor of DNA gyrase (YacG/DUF329 family)
LEITHIKCPSCGGQVDCSKDFETATCQFCHAVLALEWSGKDNTPQIDNKCPNCGKIVQPDFVACPYCAETILVECPECGKHVRKSWTACPYCSAPLSPEARRKILADREAAAREGEEVARQEAEAARNRAKKAEIESTRNYKYSLLFLTSMILLAFGSCWLGTYNAYLGLFVGVFTVVMFLMVLAAPKWTKYL